jgi:hypothetical protein
VIWSLAPTVVVAVLFFFVLRGILRVDRTERRVYAEIEAEERAKLGMPPKEELSRSSSSRRVAGPEPSERKLRRGERAAVVADDPAE